MNEQHITITDRTTVSRVQAILGAIAAVIVSILGVGFVPGFFVAALADWVIPLHIGPIWGITLLSSLMLLGAAWWLSHQSFRQGIIRYTLSALCLLIGLIIVSLFLSGDVFYGFTLRKMFEASESEYQQIEQERGRLSIPATANPEEPTTGEIANPPTVSTDTTSTSETETTAADPCQTLNDTRFTGMNGYYYLRLFHQKGDTYEFVGRVEARDVNGFIKREGDELVVTSGNINGRFTLLNNCQELTGHFTDDYGTSTSFDYSR